MTLPLSQFSVHGRWNLTPQGVCSVRVFEEEAPTPDIVMGELPLNRSTSVTNMAEHLAPELIQCHFPTASKQRSRRSSGALHGHLGREATWDRLSFHSWVPRRVWLSGQ